mmetsp:Transcript_37871/g.117027  ORF Transcript_37871/g.117027 Transcript_37871/m.117027 type:complete len:267 (+) Transcript_37871:348-1148(+)
MAGRPSISSGLSHAIPRGPAAARGSASKPTLSVPRRRDDGDGAWSHNDGRPDAVDAWVALESRCALEKTVSSSCASLSVLCAGVSRNASRKPSVPLLQAVVSAAFAAPRVPLESSSKHWPKPPNGPNSSASVRPRCPATEALGASNATGEACCSTATATEVRASRSHAVGRSWLPTRSSSATMPRSASSSALVASTGGTAGISPAVMRASIGPAKPSSLGSESSDVGSAAASNALRPAMSSYSTHPSDHMSALASYGRLPSTSGAT